MDHCILKLGLSNFSEQNAFLHQVKRVFFFDLFHIFLFRCLLCTIFLALSLVQELFSGNYPPTPPPIKYIMVHPYAVFYDTLHSKTTTITTTAITKLSRNPGRIICNVSNMSAEWTKRLPVIVVAPPAIV